MHKLLSCCAALLALAAPAHAQTLFTVALRPLADQKAVFATVESPNLVPARTRIGGTLAGLSVHQGDPVKQGQVIAVVGDDKLLLQIHSLDAQIDGLQSQLAQAQIGLQRARRRCSAQGAGPRQRWTRHEPRWTWRTAPCAARTAERAVAQQNLDEGAVLAPVAGRVIAVPLTKGSVVLNGDTVATIGEQPFMLRLRIPERHALLAEGRRHGTDRRRTAWRGTRRVRDNHPDLSSDRGRPGGGRRAGARALAITSSATGCGSGSMPATGRAMWCLRASCIPASGWIT